MERKKKIILFSASSWYNPHEGVLSFQLQLLPASGPGMPTSPMLISYCHCLILQFCGPEAEGTFSITCLLNPATGLELIHIVSFANIF